MAMFYHYGIVQKIIAFISKIMQKTMGSSGAETTSVSANIFVGQTFLKHRYWCHRKCGHILQIKIKFD